MLIPIKDGTVAENLAKNQKGKQYWLYSLQSTLVEMASRKNKHIKMKPRIYLLFVFDLDGECKFNGECKFIKNKTLY